MKKITFLFLSLLTIVFANAQTNLLTNSGFETWASSFPGPWYVVGSTPPTGYTATQNTTIFKEGTSSIKMNVPTSASGTISVSQVLAIVPGGSYTLTVNYYVESGDGTDARVWCNFKKGTAFFAEAELVATGLYSQLRGPGMPTLQEVLIYLMLKGLGKLTQQRLQLQQMLMDLISNSGHTKVLLLTGMKCR